MAIDYGFKDRVALVVGGGDGSGSIFSTLFAQEGGKVVVADVREEAAQEVVERIKAAGGEATAVKLNVLDETDMINAVKLCEEKYGGLHYGINIVGTSLDFCDLTQVPSENFDKMFHICVQSTFFGLKHQIPAILRTGQGGAVINMGSNGSLVAHKDIGLYDACKHAVLGMSKSAALDFASRGVRVNVICPGVMLSRGLKQALEKDPHFADKWIQDIPSGKLQTYEEVAHTFMFLCSKHAASITGVALPVDGGQVAD